MYRQYYISALVYMCISDINILYNIKISNVYHSFTNKIEHMVEKHKLILWHNLVVILGLDQESANMWVRVAIIMVAAQVIQGDHGELIASRFL